jgi:hypothetical protein
MAIALPPIDLGGAASVTGATNNGGVTCGASLTNGDALLCACLWPSNPGAITASTFTGGAGTWTTQVATIANGTAIYLALFSYVALGADGGTTPTFTAKWTNSVGYNTRLVKVGGGAGNLDSSATNNVASQASPFTAPTITPVAANVAMLNFFGINGVVTGGGSSGTGWANLGTYTVDKTLIINYKTATTSSASNDVVTWTGAINASIVDIGISVAPVLAATLADTASIADSLAAVFTPIARGGGGAGTFRRRFWRLRP